MVSVIVSLERIVSEYFHILIRARESWLDFTLAFVSDTNRINSIDKIIFTIAKLRKNESRTKKFLLFFCHVLCNLSKICIFAAEMRQEIAELLRNYAQRYETKDFLNGDPSWFMHQVYGDINRETTAFVASALSYGSRAQFLPKISWMLDRAEGDIYEWVKQGAFETDFRNDEMGSFYRLYSYRTMNTFLRALQKLLVEYESLGTFVKESGNDGLSAVSSLCEWFAAEGATLVVPKDTKSACKRLCMFLRWMVRSDSPVDLGLWSKFIDRRTLIIPLDTHVLQQSVRLGLLNSKTATMSTAIRLTKTLAEIFPEDPLKGDFALFGYGVNN